MRFIPSSIPGQLLVVWLLTMLVAHAIAVLTMSWWRADSSSIHPISIRMIETRIVSAYRLAAMDRNAGPLLEGISLPDAQFRLTPGPIAATPMSDKEQRFVRDLQRMLDLPPDTPMRVSLQQTALDGDGRDRRNWLERAFGKPLSWELHIEIGLPGDQTLVSDHWPILVPAHWGRVLSFSMLVGMIPTALIAVIFGRRIMRPIRRLTGAANRVSRGEQVILPSVKGPDGVREITQAFNDMQRNLIRFVHNRTMMVAAIGHDLRTPMTSLRIRAELVEDTELREAMIRTLDDMRVMVDEILKFAKDDAMQEPTQEISLSSLIQDVVDEHRMLGREVAFQPHLPAEYAYRCRPVHFKRALNNLIDNAAHFGPVEVKLLEDAERGRLKIEVLDCGPGIAPDQLEHVLEPFVRLDESRSSTTGGVGLGLTIAQSCVQAHGGSITLKNRDSGGLCATIELPA